MGLLNTLQMMLEYQSTVHIERDIRVVSRCRHTRNVIRDELYKNRSSRKTDSQQEKMSSGSPILLIIVSENWFSGKTYFYTIASSAIGHFASFVVSCSETTLLYLALYFFPVTEETLLVFQNLITFFFPSMNFVIYPLIETLCSQNLRDTLLQWRWRPKGNLFKPDIYLKCAREIAADGEGEHARQCNKKSAVFTEPLPPEFSNYLYIGLSMECRSNDNQPWMAVVLYKLVLSAPAKCDP